MVLILLLVFLAADNQPQSNSWHGIIPLRSTRADVEKLLGSPTPESKALDAAFYRTENERVFVLYSNGPCDVRAGNYWNVPLGTVITFSVYPNVKPKFTNLKLDESKYKKKEDPEVLDLVYYTSEEEGVSIEVNISEGVVNAIRYSPASRDNCLRCHVPS
jgi:hypothetical protein